MKLSIVVLLAVLACTIFFLSNTAPVRAEGETLLQLRRRQLRRSGGVNPYGKRRIKWRRVDSYGKTNWKKIAKWRRIRKFRKNRGVRIQRKWRKIGRKGRKNRKNRKYRRVDNYKK